MNYDWMTGDAVAVAPMLLGWTLVHYASVGEMGGLIVETEAYRAQDDAASHGHGRLPTSRTAPMFGLGGTIYIYFTYGMHFCLNISTGPMGEAQAVLIRALEPIMGVEHMRPQRPAGTTDRKLASGPGNLCRVMGIDKTLSGSRLGEAIELIPPIVKLEPNKFSAGPRIGIRQAVDLPWRFWITGHPSVSK